jgi:hypothetical protein
MIEVKHSSTWSSPLSRIIPSQNLTANDKKKLAERQAIIDRLAIEVGASSHWLKINNGIFKGTIFRANPHSNSRRRESVSVHIYPEAVWKSPTYSAERGEPKLKDQAPIFTNHFSMHIGWGDQPIKVQNHTIYPTFCAQEVLRNCSLLLDYEGDPVFCMDEKKRPLTFEDRLGQEVNIGDLVVVAYNYGAGLDLCLVKGFSDETRVVIESVESGEVDRIPLENNATRKIMRMPDSIEEIAVMMRLARKD